MRALLLLAVLLLVVVVYGGALNGKLRKREVNRCYKSNEVYSDCGLSCPKTCDSALQASNNVYCPELCVPGCFCREGYVRNRWGNCILLEQCPCRGRDEVFSCDSGCRVTCDALGKSCPNNTDNCVTACWCRDGFAKDNSGTCIPIPQCPGYKS